MGKVYTRAQAEPGHTRLLPNHFGLPQTNELRQCTLAGRYRSSTHQEDCCLPHGTHTPNNRRQTSTIPSPTSCKQIEVAEELHAHRHAARLVCKQQDAEALERQPDRRAILCQNGSVKIDRLRTGVGRAKTTMRRWGYLDDAQSVDCDCGEPQTMAHLLSCRLLDEACTADDLATVTERAKACARKWENIV